MEATAEVVRPETTCCRCLFDGGSDAHPFVEGSIQATSQALRTTRVSTIATQKASKVILGLITRPFWRYQVAYREESSGIGWAKVLISSIVNLFDQRISMCSST